MVMITGTHSHSHKSSIVTPTEMYACFSSVLQDPVSYTHTQTHTHPHTNTATQRTQRPHTPHNTMKHNCGGESKEPPHTHTHTHTHPHTHTHTHTQRHTHRHTH